jgi:large subunit ribosomal protein L31
VRFSRSRTSGNAKESTVKSKIHPKYQACTVHCACGNTFVTRSTAAKINVDICSACHPFFTGKQKFVDTAGRVDKFTKKFGGSYQRAGGGAAQPAAAGAKK